MVVLCRGRATADSPCRFNRARQGQPAQVNKSVGRCLFCDADAMAAAMLNKAARSKVLTALRCFDGPTVEAAMAYIPEGYHAWAHDGLRKGRARCLGMNGELCVFAATSRPTAVEVKGRRRHCVFCDTEALAAACQEQAQKEYLMDKMRCMGHSSRAAALARIPVTHKAEFLAVIDAPLRPARRVLRRPATSVDAGPVPPREMEHRNAAGVAAWASVLAKRRSCKAAPGRSAQKRYRERILDDRARARRRLGRQKERTPRGAAVTNETSLPPAKRSRRACDLEQWCKFNSWSTCPRCSMLWERPLTERTLGADLPAELPKACRICDKNGKAPDDAVDCFVPSPDDVPLQLRGLSPEAREALSPLVSDVGPEVRAENNTGYRQHATMIRFSWHERSVKHRVRRIRNDDEHILRMYLLVRTQPHQAQPWRRHAYIPYLRVHPHTHARTRARMNTRTRARTNAP